MLLIVCGMIATGKSTIAWLLSALTGFAVLSSDRVRKELAGVAPTAHKTNDYQQGIYSEEFTRLTYERLLATAEKRLAAGEGAIIDATFGKPQHRQQFLALASRFNIPVFFVESRADESTIANRLQERKKANNETSDATWEIYQRMSREFKSFSDLPENCHLPINTGNELLPALSKLEMRF
jgi:predicted kinase